MTRSARSLLAIGMLGAALWAAPSARSEGTRITAGPTRLEFFAGSDASSQTIAVTVEGGTAGQVTLRLVDAIIDPSGGWSEAPFGTTPSTLEGLAVLQQDSFPYVPTDAPQEFDAVLSVALEAIDGPRFGSVIVSVVPETTEGDPGATVTQIGAVALQVLAAPDEGSLEDRPDLEAALAFDGLAVRATTPWTPVDRLLPDLPGLVNHGPVEVAARGRNVGSVVLDQRVRYEFVRLNPIELLTGGEPNAVLTIENLPTYLLPGQRFDDSARSRLVVDGVETGIDALPLVGFVRIRATATGSLAGLSADPVSREITVLVFPWKEAAFLFVVWLFQREWRHRSGRRVHAGEAPPPPTLRRRVWDAAGSLRGRPGPS